MLAGRKASECSEQMSKAYLRIDDSPSKITPDFIDYLTDKGITPIIFAVGKNIKKHFDNAVYALKKGAIIGNHSFSHPQFSSLTFKQCISDIEKCELWLEKLYVTAEVERKYKFFAFPYGDKGGKNKDKLQQYLKNKGFSRIDDRNINFDWYKEYNLDKDIDVFWTFDFGEYQLQQNNSFLYETILYRIHDKNPDNGGVLLEPNSNHIVMIHDHDMTNKVMPEYYKTILDHVIDCGVEFIQPKFI